MDTKRKVLVGALVALSLCGWVAAAYCVGHLAHIGVGVVQAGDAPPNSMQWIQTAFSLALAFVPASWAKYLLFAQQAVPVITNTIGTIRGTPAPAPQPDGSAPPAVVVVGPFAPLQELLNSIDVGSGGEIKSTGEHPIAGGKVTWSITFTPAGKGVPLVS